MSILRRCRSAVLVLAAPVATLFAQGAPATPPGTMALAGLPAGARDAALAAIDAWQGWRFLEAHEQINKALSIDSTFGLARAWRANRESGPTTEWVNAEYRRATVDAAGRGAAEAAYLSALRSAGASASQFYTAARGMLPNDRRIALDQAIQLIGQERIDSLRSVTRQYPDFVGAHAWLIFYLAQSRAANSGAEIYEAYVLAQRLVRMAPNNAQSHAALGHALQRLGRLDEAAAHLQAATKMDPRAAYPYVLEAEIYARDGKPKGVDRARAAYDSAMATDPNATRKVNQRRERAFLLFFDGRKAEGHSELAALAKEFEVSVPNGAATVLAQAAAFAAGSGDSAMVERLLGEARRVGPTANLCPYSVYAYGMSKQAAAARRERDDCVRRAVDTTTVAFGSDRHRWTGSALFAEGKATEALAELRQADENNPFTGLAMMDAYNVLGNKVAAAKALSDIIDRDGANASLSFAIARYRSIKK